MFFFCFPPDDADPVLAPKVQKLTDNYSQMEELVNTLFTSYRLQLVQLLKTTCKHRYHVTNVSSLIV